MHRPRQNLGHRADDTTYCLHRQHYQHGGDYRIRSNDTLHTVFGIVSVIAVVILAVTGAPSFVTGAVALAVPGVTVGQLKKLLPRRR